MSELKDPRYNSGTSLEKTAKEEEIDRIESLVPGNFSDHLFLGLKQLTLVQLRELRKAIDAKGT